MSIRTISSVPSIEGLAFLICIVNSVLVSINAVRDRRVAHV